MDIIIDKVNLEYIIKDDYLKRGQSFTDFVKSKSGINVVCNFSIEDDFCQKDIFRQWLKTLTEGNSSTYGLRWAKTDEIIDSSSIKTNNFITSLNGNQLKNIFLLDNDNEIPKIDKKGGIIIAKAKEHESAITKLKIDENEKLLKKINWIEYLPHIPLTDIIIIDPYFLENYYEDDPIFENLINGLTSYPCQGKINLVIITSLNGQRKSDIEQEIHKIKKQLKKQQQSKWFVTVILMHNIHDRDIITNYYRLTSGQGFLHPQNKFKQNSRAYLKCHTDKDADDFSNELIQDVQSAIIEKELEIIGDKKSNFLHFSKQT